MTCIPCCVTLVSPSSLSPAPLGRIQTRAAAARPESGGNVFQQEFEEADCESLESAPRALQAGTQGTERPGLNADRAGSLQVTGNGPELDADPAPGPQETARPSQGQLKAPHAASAAVQTAGQGHASTRAKKAGVEGSPERTGSVVAQESGQPCEPAESGARSRGDVNNTMRLAGALGASGAEALLNYEGQPCQSRVTGEKAAKTAENPPSGPVLERTSLPAGSAKDTAFAVKCFDAATGAPQSGSVAEPATLSGKLPACPPAPSEATGPVASAGREGSSGTGNQPRSGFAEQGESPVPRKLTDAALKEEGTMKSDAPSGKQSTLQAGSGQGSAGVEKGSLAVAAPPTSQAHATSNGPGNAPPSRTALEPGTIQSPAAASEPGAVQSPGRIDLRVQGQQNERVDIRLVARGSELQVTVKTASPALTTELRGGLQDLVQSLRDSGYQTEAWRPLPPGSPASNASNDAGREQGQPHEGGQSGRESASGWQQENRGDRGRQDNPPRWVEELEASSAGSPHTNWRELSWRQ